MTQCGFPAPTQKTYPALSTGLLLLTSIPRAFVGSSQRGGVADEHSKVALARLALGLLGNLQALYELVDRLSVAVWKTFEVKHKPKLV